MAKWSAKCWLGSKSGYVDLEVDAATWGGAEEQLKSIYGAQQIINLREIRSSSSISSTSDVEWHLGHTILAAVIGGAVLLAFAGEWVGMILGGAGGTWIGQKLTGQTIDEYNSSVNTTEEQHKKAAYLLAIALVSGGLGFALGSNIKASINDSSAGSQSSNSCEQCIHDIAQIKKDSMG